MLMHKVNLRMEPSDALDCIALVTILLAVSVPIRVESKKTGSHRTGSHRTLLLRRKLSAISFQLAACSHQLAAISYSSEIDGRAPRRI
jgi:hypothetical protein